MRLVSRKASGVFGVLGVLGVLGIFSVGIVDGVSGVGWVEEFIIERQRRSRAEGL